MAASDASVKQLQLQITASTELLLRNLKQADQVVDRFSTDAERSAARIDRAFERVGNGVRSALGLLAGVSLAALARDFLDVADQAKSMEAQLKLATSTFGNFGQAQLDVQRIAAVTRNDLTATATLYGNFVRSSESLGKSQADAARATETFSKALKLGGADAAATASATLQFGQALASGVLRGDEFNSIAEASPRILRLIADSAGVSAGELRGMAADGKLSADVLYKALTERQFTAGIDAEFAELPVTFGDAMTLVNNAAVTTFGAFDRGGQFSSIIASFVSDGAGQFSDLEKAAEQFGIEARADIEGLRNVFDPLGESGAAVFDALGIRIQSVRDQIASILNQYDQIQNLFIDVNNAAYDFDQAYLPSWLRSGGVGGTRLERSNREGLFQAGVANSEMASRRRLVNDASNRDSVFRFSGDPLDIGNFTPTPPRGPQAPSRAAGAKSKGSKGAAKKAPTLADRLKSEAEGSGSYISADLAAAGADANTLAVNLGGVDQALAGIRTGIEGVDLGQILTEEEQRRIEYFTDNIRRDLTDGLAQAAIYGGDLGDVLINSIKRASAELLSSGLMDLLSGNSFGASFGGGGFGKLLGGLFGGAFAAGGAPPLNKISLVGERGPELFVPKVDGTIIPNHALGDGGRMQVDAIVSVRPSPLFETSVEQTTLRTVGAAAEPIMAGAQVRTMKAMGRRSLPGGYGG